MVPYAAVPVSACETKGSLNPPGALRMCVSVEARRTSLTMPKKRRDSP